MIKYTEKQKEFLISNNYMKPAKELALMFNKKFGTNLTAQNIKTFRGNHKLNSGLTGRFEKGNIPFNKGTKGLMKANKTSFKKGNIPYNHKKVGYERINVDGYIEIKVKEPNIFKLKHRIIYEQYHGEIPKGHKVIFADGNKLNLDPNNLILVSDSEELIMNRNKLRYNEAELTKTGTLIAKVIDKIHKVKKMADYEQLYWDSQYEIKKLKKQIELLENEIAVQRETKNSKARKVIINELNRYLKRKQKSNKGNYIVVVCLD